MANSRASSLEVEAPTGDDRSNDEEQRLPMLPIDHNAANANATATVPTTNTTARNIAARGAEPKEKTQWLSLPNAPRGTYLDISARPIRGHREAFEDLVQKALAMGFRKILNLLDGHAIKIGTMCSGTETPIVALQLVQEALHDMGLQFSFEHIFSSEIVPWKQTWILRNFEPQILFRDVAEMSEGGEAMTVYGQHARIPPPGSVHILVAGFACVDFSMLNNRRKELVVHLDDMPPEELLEKLGGESSLTLTAILKYARHYRPPIIVLENILGASWPQIIKLFQQISYSAAVAKLDTKYFYIPQTRQRGYLICINNEHNKEVGGMNKSDAEAAIQKWGTLLRQFMRTASSPVDDFLFPDNHPDLLRALRDIASESGTQWETDFAKDWSVCWGRYQRFRETRKLGGSTPYTHWRSGKVRPPEHTHAEWLQRQPNRIKDTIDCIHLLSAQEQKRDYDAQYKARFPDASQNVDRSVDSAKPGIVGCITPNNILFHTAKGRPPVGLEQLRLQGMDSNRLLVGRESQKQLRDLAGNAMSTTVIGSAIVAALLAAFDAINPDTWGERQARTAVQWIGDRFFVEPCSEMYTAQPLYFGPIERSLPLEHFCSLAEQTVRMCHCEGLWNRSSAPIGRCQECGHTACEDCGGNPIHEYNMVQNEERYNPRAFVRTALKYLPTRLKLSNFETLQYIIVDLLNGIIVKEKLAVLQERYKDVLAVQAKEKASQDRRAAAQARKDKKAASVQRSSSVAAAKDSSAAKSGSQAKTDKLQANSDMHPEEVLKHYDLLSKGSTTGNDGQGTISDVINKQVTHSDELSGALINLNFDEEDLRMLPLDRSYLWLISYESANLILTLALKDGQATWLLYLKAPDNLAAGSDVRSILKQPIATMSPTATNQESKIWHGRWEARIYDKREYPVWIKGEGDKVPSWRAELGLKEYRDEQVYSRLSIKASLHDDNDEASTTVRSISGVYELLPKCGTATRSLHRQVRQEHQSSPVYLFLESLPNQRSDLDEFVFALDHERASSADPRKILARVTNVLDSRNMRGTVGSNEGDEILPGLIATLSWADQAVVAQYLARSHPGVASYKPDVVRLMSKDGPRTVNWRPLSAKNQLVNIVVEHRSQPFNGQLTPASSQDDVCFLPTIPETLVNPLVFLSHAASHWAVENNVDACRMGDALLVKTTIPWHGPNPDGRRSHEPCVITELNQRTMHLNLEWFVSRIFLRPELQQWSALKLTRADFNCGICSPQKPAYLQCQMPGGGLLPMEDSEGVVNYLKRWNEKPCPLTISTRRQKNSKALQDLCITVNIRCLLHRLLARLQSHSQAQYKEVHASWRICTDVIIDRGHGQIGSLKVHDCTDEEPFYHQFQDPSLVLRTDQARVYQWMLRRDTLYASTYREVIVEENVSTHLRWSIEAQSIRQGVFRGGLCADHVGFGKTIVVLAVLRSHMHEASLEAEAALASGLQDHIPIRATLILVPGPLTYQWAEEIDKFWGVCKYIRINTMDELHLYSVHDFQSVDVIIVSVDMLQQKNNADYTNRIAEIAGMADPAPFTLSRQYAEWAKTINPKVSHLAKDLQDDSLSADDCAKRLRDRSYEYRYTTSQHVDPSKRLRGRQLMIEQRSRILGGGYRGVRAPALSKPERVPGEITGFRDDTSEARDDLKREMRAGKRPRLESDGSAIDDYTVVQPMPTAQLTVHACLELTTLPSDRKRKAVERPEPESIGKIIRKEFYGPILSLFRFHRKVIDEISYLNGYQETAIKSIPSNVTWLLSGTARLRDTMDVKRLAALIGVHIGHDDDSHGHASDSNRKLVDESRSDLEKIEASKTVHTERWHRSRLISAQAFLDTFARTNMVELPASSTIKIKEYTSVSRLPSLHIALYHEARTFLVTEGFKDITTYTGAGKHDRSMRLIFSLHNTQTTEHALIKTGFYMPRAEGYSMMQHACHALPDLEFGPVLQERRKDIVRLTRAVIRRTDHFMEWIQLGANPSFMNKKDANFLLDVIKRAMFLLNSRILQDVGDPDAVKQLTRLNSWATLPARQCIGLSAKKTRRRLDRLSKLVDAMVSAVRSYRYLKNARKLQQMAWNEEETSTIDDFGHLTAIRQARLNGLCGHLICAACAVNLRGPICPVPGCTAGAGADLLIDGADLAQVDMESRSTSTKIQSVLNIVRALHKEGQAIIFCQWHDMNEVLLSYLRNSGINAQYVRDGDRTTVNKVAEFKGLSYGHPHWAKVLILNPLSSTAAGHNLQNVNAIVFLTPLSATSIDDYTASYTQSIGRAARFGQRSIVKVYHLLASNTIEINIHESRRKTKLYIQGDDVVECAATEMPPNVQQVAINGYVPRMPE